MNGLRLRSSRFACVLAALLILFAAPVARGECTDPPFVSASGSVDMESGKLIVTVTHNDVTWIQVWWDDASHTLFPYQPEQNPMVYEQLLWCRTSPGIFKVMGWKGGSDCEPATATTSGPALNQTPKLTPEVKPIDDKSTAVRVYYDFPYSNGGRIKKTVYPPNAPYYVAGDGPTQEAKAYSALTVPHGSLVVVEATACTGVVTTTAVVTPSTSCSSPKEGSCPSCFGEPIHAVSGNMEYRDADPLPGVGDVLPFERTYHSQNRSAGAFGPGWTSVFEARVTTIPTAQTGFEWVRVVDETGALYLFRGAPGGPYTQQSPRGGSASTTLERTTTGWTHTDERRVRSFDMSGWPVSFGTRASDREVLLTWTNGRVSRVIDSWGAWALAVATDATTGYITSIALETDPATAWTYGYEGNLLARVDSPIGRWRTYEHAPAAIGHLPLGTIRDGAGKIIESHAYAGSDRRVLTSLQQTDDITDISALLPGRNDEERKRVVTYRNGRTETYYSRYTGGDWHVVEVDGGCTSCGGNSSVSAYDSFGNVIRSQAEDGYITARTYDPTGERLVQEVTALQPENCDPSTASDRCRLLPEALEAMTALGHTAATTTTNYLYEDPNWTDRPTTITTVSVLNPTGNRREVLTYDPASGEVLSRAVTGWTGDPLRQETRVSTTTLYDGTAGAEFAPGGTFNSAWLTLPQPRGFRRKIDGPRTDAADFTAMVHYPTDASVPALLRGRLAATRNAAGHITRFEDYDLHGNARRVIDPNGVVTMQTFDALGRATSTTVAGVPGCDTTADPLCNTAMTSTRAYSGAGPLASETNATGGVTSYGYDDYRRVASVSRGPSASDLRERIETTYDPGTGRKSMERSLARENGVWVEKQRTTFRYDLSGRLDQTTNADNSTVGYTYDSASRLTSVRDEKHTSPNTFYSYDPAGRLTSVRQALATAPGGYITTTYGYDTHGNLTSVIDPNGNETTYVYDDFGQLLRQVSPVTGTTTYTYDTAGNLTSTSDANGASTSRTYDILGRVLTATSTRGSAVEQSTWTYDSGSFGLGHVSSISDPTGVTTYQYDRRGLLLREQKTIGSTTYTTAFGYGADGSRTRIAYPSGNVVQYTYDYAGRPLTATSGQTPIVTSARYLPFGPVSEVVYGNGTTRQRTYDARYRPLINELLGPAGAIARYAYTHDPAGNVTAIADELNHTYDRTFDYDELNRLTVANSGSALWGTGSYTYDAMGNLVTATLGTTTRQFQRSGTTPKLTSVSTNGAARPVSHDAAGNETIDSAAYSPRNFLSASALYNYEYDARGVRTITTFASAGAVQTITTSPGGIRGGNTVQATVTLDEAAPAGGATVRLASGHADVQVPAEVTVPAGSTTATFSVQTNAVTTDRSVEIVATRGTTVRTTLGVWRSCVVSALVFSPSSVTGGTAVTATLSLHEPAGSAGATVSLTSSDPTVLAVPATMTVPAGETFVTFTVTPSAVSALTTTTVTAELCGLVAQTLEVRPPAVASVTVAPSTVRSGLNATGTVVLTGPAPAGGTSLVLSTTDSTAATVPASSIIPAGQTSGTFTVQTTPRDVATSVQISASGGGATGSAALAITRCLALAQQPTYHPAETVWFDDILPAGASAQGAWAWETQQSASGSASVGGAPSTALVDRTFDFATATMTPGNTDMLFLYVLIDPCNPPREIMVAWSDNGQWRRAYWGEDLIHRAGRVRAGNLPVAGEWVRLEVPSAAVSVNNKPVRGLQVTIDRGRVWFDRGGKRLCDIGDTTPPASFPANEEIWFDDAPPAGATLSGTWMWDTSVRASGTSSHTDVPSPDTRTHTLTVSTAPFTPAAGDELFVYAYVDPCNPPQEIMVEWFGNGTGWLHRAYWGADAIIKSPRTRIGDMPQSGAWVRLAVPAYVVGATGQQIRGISFSVHGGRVWFDRVGVARCQFAGPAVQPTVPSNEFVWVDDAIPPGASVDGSTWTWDMTYKVTGTQSILSTSAAGTERQTRFINATTPIAVSANDIFFAHVLLDSCNPPRELMFWFRDTTGDWVHRPHWGEALMVNWYAGLSMGALPPSGEWVQVEMPARGMNLAGRSVAGMALWTHGGRTWVDRIGKRTCVMPAAPAPSLSPSEVVWFDDAPPPGATLTGPWTWDTVQRASGNTANMVPPGGESLEYSFQGGTTFAVGNNDMLTVYALIDTCDPPREIMLSWYDGTSWDHRAYWGENIYTYGTPGPARYSMGALPATGQWVRLEIPASAVNLGGRTVSGMKFSTFAGKAWFDRVGLEPGALAPMASAAPATASSIESTPKTFRARWSERLRRFGSVLARGRRLSTFSNMMLQVPEPAPVETQTATSLRRYSFYTPELNLLAETAVTTAASPAIAHEYVWFAGEPAAQITTSTGEIAWYFNDHLGTPILQTDATADVVWRVEREPYGTPYTYRAGATRHQPLAFPGQEERAGEGELAYNIFRWYRSGWGRYTQSDPAGLVGREYPYASNNPVLHSDMLGLRDTGAALSRPTIQTVCRVTRQTAGAFAGRALGMVSLILSAPDANPVECEPCAQLRRQCRDFQKDVEEAKRRVGDIGGCREGMTRPELLARRAAWLALATARARRDVKCWGGGDQGHQEAHAAAWEQVGKCSRLLGM